MRKIQRLLGTLGIADFIIFAGRSSRSYNPLAGSAEIQVCLVVIHGCKELVSRKSGVQISRYTE